MSVLKSTQHGSIVVAPFRFRSALATAEGAGQAVPTSEDEARPVPSQERASNPVSDEKLAQARRIAELEQALRDQRVAAAKELETAKEVARLAGKQEAEKLDAERLAALEGALRSARSDAIKAFEAQRNLAVEIARVTLSQILGDESAFASLVVETAGYWKARLAGAAVLQVRVSSHDFQDGSSLERLKVELGNIEIEQSAELEPGACVFELKLGQVDASIPLQANNADGLLEDHGVGMVTE